MIDPHGLQRAWDRTHREKPSPQQPEEEVVAFAERLRRQLPARARVLDAGCGRGRNAAFLSQMDFITYGCDLSAVAIEIARTRVRQAHRWAQVADLRHLPYPDGVFAAVICVHVFPYHLKADMTRVMQELRRVLQPRGWLYVDLLDLDDAEYRHGQELEPNTFLDPDGMPVHFSTRWEVEELAGGLEPERVARIEAKSAAGKRVMWVVWAVKPPL